MTGILQRPYLGLDYEAEYMKFAICVVCTWWEPEDINHPTTFIKYSSTFIVQYIVFSKLRDTFIIAVEWVFFFYGKGIKISREFRTYNILMFQYFI